MLLSSLIAQNVQADLGVTDSANAAFVKNKTGAFDASGAATAAQTAAATDATTKANAAAAAAVPRANHTGTQSADTITDGSTNKAYTAVEQTKLTRVRNLGFKLTAVNLNSVADNSITGLPAKWRPIKLTAFDASATPVLAAVGLFTAATGGGTNMLSAMVLTSLTGATKIADATLISITDYRTETTMYLRNVTAQGTALTASFALWLEDLT